eukprot:CAMPEP_0197037488 /NCGR_PEP_ID=MMETSP1384-20130603/14691_1 /TAXON_ID=29189 /ORGANISM="Ammonia sp." /LENGTH=465 /DNA_ID=CAMNT_0042467799 /DNA_START=34 /DNA_END=1432 /DNA_ORIENTATION=+
MAEQKQQSLDVIIAIGSTGLGKSTLIKSYCKSEAVKTSSSVLSCTKNSHLYTELDDKAATAKRIWLDTMGAEDSEKKMKDEDILSGVMQMLVNHVPNDAQLQLKILWFVKPECRKTGPLQTQANFIKHIADGSNQNAWNSTVIIQKEGLYDPSSKIQGALSASLDFGAPWKGATDSDGNRLGGVKCIGYTRVDCLEHDDPALEDYNDPEYPKHRKLKKGLLNEAEMMTEIDKLVNAISFVPVSVHKQKCKKCGVIGDKRWVKLLCHGQPNKIHPKGSELIHVKASINIHRLNGSEPFHHGKVERYHKGSLEWKSIGGRYHRGSFNRTYTCPKGHSLSEGWHRTKKLRCAKCKCTIWINEKHAWCNACPSFSRNFCMNCRIVKDARAVGLAAVAPLDRVDVIRIRSSDTHAAVDRARLLAANENGRAATEMAKLVMTMAAKRDIFAVNESQAQLDVTKCMPVAGKV